MKRRLVETPVEVIHVRLPSEMVRLVDHLAVDWRVYRAEAVQRLLALALAETIAERNK